MRINTGNTYGEAGEGFIRINIECPRGVLVEGLERLEKVKKNFNKHPLMSECLNEI